MLAQLGVGNIGDVTLAPVEHLNFFLVGVDAGNTETSVGESDRQGQSYVTHADYGDVSAFLLNFFNQFFFNHGFLL